MQSYIALAGAVGLAAAAYAPNYNDDARATTQAAAFPGQYEAPAAFRTVDAQLPAYSSSADNARIEPYHSEALRLTSPLAWSTTEYISTSAYETYCPEATTLTFDTNTYTVTAATTLTVSDCYNGCEVVKPLPTTTIYQTAPHVTTTNFETYVPKPTILTFSAETWTVTEATTLTIPQKITTTSVFKTVIPIQPTYAPTSFVKVTTADKSPVSPVETIEPYVPAKSEPVQTPEAYVPAKSEEAPVQTIEPFVPAMTEEPAAIVPTTATYDAIVPPYPSAPAMTTPAYYQPTGTGSARVYPTQPVLYTGAGSRVGAGALMAVVGLAAFF